MKKTLSWKLRSIVILSVGMLIFGAVLTTLAIKEAEREKLAEERDRNSEWQRYAGLLSAGIDSLFTGIEEKISSALTGERKQADLLELSDICRRTAENENLIADIFILEKNDDAIFPLKGPRISAAERKRLAAQNLAKIEKTDLFRSAEAAEWRDKNLPLAVLSYGRLLDSVHDHASRALVLNRLARCHLKSGNTGLALTTYKTILADFSTELSSEGVPLGIIASYQIVGITQKTEPGKTGPALLDFFSRLVSSEWPLDKAQFQIYRGLIEKTGEAWRTDLQGVGMDTDFQNRWEEVEKLAEDKFMELTEDEDLIRKIIPVVRTRISESEGGTPTFVRIAETIGDNLFLISASLFQQDKVLGIRMDDTELIQNRLPAILNSLSTPDDWIVQIIDSSGRAVFAADSFAPEKEGQDRSFSAGLATGYPPWQVRIYHKNPRQTQKQLMSRRNIYILVVVLVTAVLFFGGFAVIRSTAKELELARLKSEFVAAVSHEFRTPLMSIRYLSEMLDTGRVIEEEKKRTYYGRINRESVRLSRLIENMLDFSKIEAGMKKYKFEKFDVRELIEDVAGRFKDFVSDKKVTLKCEIPECLAEIDADRESISRALFNLLDNAVKYSNKTPVIFLRAGVSGDSVYLEVEDKGMGIGLDEQKRVFEKFYRSSDSGRKNIEGSGIGLTLVAHIVKAHGGEVRLASEPGKGTRVTVVLPLSRKGKKDG